MRLAALPLVAVIAGAGWAVAQEEPGPLARASLEPDVPVTVGEPVVLTVEVLVPSWFTGAPRYPEVDLPDAMVIFEEQGGFNFNERIGGTSFAGQRRQYRIYPMRPGGFDLTDLAVEVRYAVNARPSAPTPVPLDPLSFEATVPEEAAGLDYFVAATEIQLSGDLEPEPKGLKVGDALTRTVTTTARDAFAMLLPPLPLESIAGLALYPDPPRVSDSGGERGAARVGERVESATYVLQEAGEYELPAIELAWWDVEARRMRRAGIPAVRFSVAPNPTLVEEIPLPEETMATSEAPAPPPPTWRDVLRRWAPWALLAVVMIVVAAGPVWRLGQRLAARLADWQRRRSESEVAYFDRFRRAAASADPIATYKGLLAWLDRCYRGPAAATVEAFVRSAEEPQLTREAEALDHRLFGEPSSRPESGSWSGRRLARLVAAAREGRGHGTAPDEGVELPELNPRR